jgi:DNA-binding transcriptional ArsR family regulator
MQLHEHATKDILSATFAALADPTRRAMLVRLSHGPATVNELAEPFEITLPTVSRHLKVLEEAGLVVKERSAQFRPCRLEATPLQAADDWIGQYRSFFSERFDRLEAQLKVMMAERQAESPKKEKPDDEL